MMHHYRSRCTLALLVASLFALQPTVALGRPLVEYHVQNGEVTGIDSVHSTVSVKATTGDALTVKVLPSTHLVNRTSLKVGARVSLSYYPHSRAHDKYGPARVIYVLVSTPPLAKPAIGPVHRRR
jgi:hypothetical protein